MVMIIRVSDLPDRRQLPKCLVDLLTSPGVIKVGCCVGNDLTFKPEAQAEAAGPYVVMTLE